MLLAREFVAYLSRQLVKKLTPQIIETSHPDTVTELISGIITEELTIEDRLNDEVRDLLSQYSDYSARGSELSGNVSPHQEYADRAAQGHPCIRPGQRRS